jgi:predicted DsbA family dithiol-disulfide isomerase
MKQWTSDHSHSYCSNNKPMELYLFVDPFCIDCWNLSIIIKKLQIEYGDYFTLKYVLCGNLNTLNRSKKKFTSQKTETTDIKNDDMPHLASISIKAAELQGKGAGARYIRRLQELFFLENADITDVNVIQLCAKRTGLDLDEFVNDIYSVSAANAYQCDLKISSEMEVTEMPALVFFNENIEDEGLKVTGLYSYDIYVQIFSEMLNDYPKPSEIPPLELFLAKNPNMATHDLALIYDQSAEQIERQMKKLQLQQKVKKINSRNGYFWKYISGGL